MVVVVWLVRARDEAGSEEAKMGDTQIREILGFEEDGVRWTHCIHKKEFRRRVGNHGA